MGTTTMGVKLDDATRERIKSAATRIDRTPHWLIKQAIFSYLEQLENSDTLPELPALLSGAANESDEAPTPAEEPHQPFLDFAEQILPQSVSRAAITAAYRRPETEAVSMLLEQAACRSQLLNRRTNWRISWPINCVIKKMPVVAQVWSRGYCRSFRCHRRKAWR